MDNGYVDEHGIFNKKQIEFKPNPVIVNDKHNNMVKYQM